MTLNPLIEPHWMQAILPEIVLSLGGMLLILVDAFAPSLKRVLAPLAIAIAILTGYAVANVPRAVYFGGTYQVGLMTQIFDFVFLLAVILAMMFARDYLHREQIEGGEFYALLLWGTAGMMMMAKGLDLLIVILGLELLSICIFVLVGYNRHVSLSNEASLKYFLMGAFATGFILYGTALFYGATQSTNVAVFSKFFADPGSRSPLLTIAFVLMIAGFGFKLALAPFHGWAPDVYQGAPTPISGWLSVAPKAATLIALFRILQSMFPTATVMHWTQILAILSIASMVVGNFVATAQRDLKRLLAYSGIAHVGYMMIAVMTLRQDAIAAVAVYAFTYALMNIGAFGVISLLDKSQSEPQTLNDIAGLGFRKPFYGLALAICMFSLAGLPPTAGFIAKFYVFKIAIDAGQIGIAVIGILTSIVSVYYYLRVVYYLYMKEPDEASATTSGGVFATGALVISIIGIFYIGLFPSNLFRSAVEAAALMLQNH